MRCDLTDLIRADDGQHGAERRQHERQNDDAEALAHIRAQVAQSAPCGSVLSGWLHIGSHLVAPPFCKLFRAQLRHARSRGRPCRTAISCVVRAEADNLAAVEHEDLIGVADGADALGDDDLCRVGQLLRKSLAERRRPSGSPARRTNRQIPEFPAFLASARAMDSRCFCPPETFRPSWAMGCAAPSG